MNLITTNFIFLEQFALFSNMDDQSDSGKSEPPGDIKIGLVNQKEQLIL
jgi:hypothetical protein